MHVHKWQLLSIIFDRVFYLLLHTLLDEVVEFSNLLIAWEGICFARGARYEYFLLSLDCFMEEIIEAIKGSTSKELSIIS